jgi:hypothetical protein
MKRTERSFLIIGGIVAVVVLCVGVPILGIAGFRFLSDNVFNPIDQLLHPTATIVPDPVTIIHDIQSLARLETIQYTIEKVVRAEIGQDILGFLFGDKLLFVAHGEVVAGLDMTKVKAEDIWLEGTLLYVRLPKAEILFVDIDNEKSYVYDRDTGVLTHGDKDLESKARQVAEEQIRDAALEDGILDNAQKNAEAYLESLFRNFGFDDVIFLYDEPAEDGTPEVVTPVVNTTPSPDLALTITATP